MPGGSATLVCRPPVVACESRELYRRGLAGVSLSVSVGVACQELSLALDDHSQPCLVL